MRVNANDLDWFEDGDGATFQYQRKSLSAAAGAAGIGCSLYRVPPGKTAFPFHAHLANEEALYILAGEGELRTAEGTSRVGPGDYVVFPAGPDHPHALRNSGAAPLEYIALSTMVEPDVGIYPDSNKVNIMAGSAPGGDKSKRTFQAILPINPVGYYDGEGGA